MQFQLVEIAYYFVIHLSQDVSTKTLSSASQIFLYPHYIGTEAELFSRLKY